MKYRWLILFVLVSQWLQAQISDSVVQLLKMDTSYAYLQYDNPAIIASLHQQLTHTAQDKFVIYHYGGSHIQGEMPPTHARKRLHEKYGNGGRGMMFSYGAADTYSSCNYTSTKTGIWAFGKSFQGNPKVPLGVCGMGVETAMPGATLDFKFKDTIPSESYLFRVFTDEDSTNFGFEILINGTTRIPSQQFKHLGDGVLELAIETDFSEIQLIVVAGSEQQNHFRFYGFDIEHQRNQGVVYHSLGVGAAAFRSVLQLDELKAHSNVLKPDMVILDFGTNDILYTNAIDTQFPKTVEKVIRQFREINPQILIVLTSTQDLYRKGKYITAGVSFVRVIDSLAKANDCFFWNWYDLAGGYGTIRHWTDLKYAKTDGIHLTANGYEVKGNFLFQSIEQTLTYYQSTHADSLLIPQRKVDFSSKTDTSALSTGGSAVERPAKTTHPVSKVYTVRKGDTLSAIAEKQHSTVAKIKKANGLRSDAIQVGQRLKIPR